MTFVYFSFLLLLGVYPTPFNLFKTIIQELKQQFQEGQETNKDCMCLPTSMFSNKNDYWLGFSQIVKNIDSNYFESLLLFIIKFS